MCVGGGLYPKLSAMCVQGGVRGELYPMGGNNTLICLLCVCAGGVKVVLTYETYELGYTDDLQDPSSPRFLAHRQRVCSDVSEAFSFLPFYWHIYVSTDFHIYEKCICVYKKSETRMTVSVLNQDPNTYKLPFFFFFFLFI